MMDRRLGFSFLYFTPRVGEAHLPWLSRLAHHGYDGAELPVVDATEAELAAMRRALDAEGLSATAVGFATDEANPVAPEPAVRRKALEHLAQIAEKAAVLGADVLTGPMHSAYGRFTEAPPTGDEQKWCAEVLHDAGVRAAAFGVTLAIEPLNRFECYLLNTAADCAALVRAADHPNVLGALDTHHAHIEEDGIPAAIAAMGATPAIAAGSSSRPSRARTRRSAARCASGETSTVEPSVSCQRGPRSCDAAGRSRSSALEVRFERSG